MTHTLPPLPYTEIPGFLSAELLSFHHGKHHNAYVNNLNNLISGTDLADVSLEALVSNINQVAEDKRKAVFNNAAQHYNHSFYWDCLTPGGSDLEGSLLAAINETWGSVEGFKEAFTKAATGHFGSGWAWLVKDSDGKLKIVDTHDADSPLAHGLTPLLTCDVWEHAYYIDFRNNRAGYVSKFWDNVNWAFASARYAG